MKNQFVGFEVNEKPIKKKFVMVDVVGLSSSDLEEKMNSLHKEGYKRVCQSNLEWYQGRGESGCICFELKEIEEYGEG